MCVVNVWDFFVGIVVFLGINTFITFYFPEIQTPREWGIKGILNNESVIYGPLPVKIAAWTAVP